MSLRIGTARALPIGLRARSVRVTGDGRAVEVA
jgi:hypothetical protein